MAEKQPQKAVFLDRDGTICEDANYLASPRDLRIFPFAADAIRLLNEAGFLVIVITNQSGVGRGYFTIEAVKQVNAALRSALADRNARLDAVYFCPHAPDDNCDCRKPKAGMITDAQREFDVSLGESWVIGDKSVDVETGRNVGAKTALVMTGYGKDELNKCSEKPDLTAENLLLAVESILRKS